MPRPFDTTLSLTFPLLARILIVSVDSVIIFFSRTKQNGSVVLFSTFVHQQKQIKFDSNCLVGANGSFRRGNLMKKTASQQSLSEEGALLHELNHRINNELAAAISTISLAAAHSENDEVKRALTGVTELLHHYADVHHALQMPEHDNPIDAAAYLSQLCVSLSQSKLK
jgi:hypothetical protein